MTENAKPTLTPIGDKCAGCSEEIDLMDQGLVVPRLTADEEQTDQTWHRDCFLDATVGMTKPLPTRQGLSKDDQSE